MSRPTGPSADDAADVLTEAGLDVRAERWPRPVLRRGSREQWVSFARRRLCVPEAREPEVAALMGDREHLLPRTVVTMWWDGRA